MGIFGSKRLAGAFRRLTNLSRREADSRLFRLACILTLIALIGAGLTASPFTKGASASVVPTFVQGAANTFDSSNSSISKSFASDTTAGDMLIVAYAWDDNFATASCSDNQGNTYSQAVSGYSSPSNQSLGICWAPVTSAGPTTVTISYSSAVDYRRIVVHEYSGLATTNPIDGTNTRGTTGTTATSNAVTTTQANSMVFGIVDSTDVGTNVQSVGSGWNSRVSAPANELVSIDQTLASPGSATPTWTLTSSGSYVAVGAGFKAAATDPTLTQSQYRWYANADSVQPGSALAAENTGASINSSSTIPRLRMNVGATNNPLNAGSQAFGLQYATSTSGPWSDVGSGAVGWWNGSWTARRKITFDNSGSSTNLTNFPVRVSLSSGNIDYAKTQNSGQDIRFVDADGTTLLSHEIEQWDEAGTSEVWVKVPQIDAGSTTDFVWMYYGNSSATDGQTPSGVWNASYKGVYHLDQDPGSASSNGVLDSTSNANNGSTIGGMTSGDSVSGPVGKAFAFDGSSKYVDNSSAAASLGKSQITMSAWVYRSFSNTYSNDVGAVSVGPNSNNAAEINWDGSNKVFDCYRAQGGSGGTPNYVDIPKTTIPANTWTRVTCTFDDTNNVVKAYVNGTLIGSDTSSMPSWSSNPAVGYIGSSVWDSTEVWPGNVDEVQLSSGIWSPDWAAADYKTESGTMNTFGSEQTSSAPDWGFYNNATPASGDNVTTNLLSGSNVLQSYSETNPTAANPNSIASGNFGEWDFALDPTNANANALYYFRMVKADGTSLDAYTTYPSIMMKPSLNQESYRLYANTDSTDVGTPLASTNTAATTPAQGTAFRLRTSVHVTGSTAAAASLSLKLQYATRSGACDAGFSGETYSDVATGSGAIRFYDNTTPADNAGATSNVNDPANHTKVMQTYEEANNASNPNAIAAGSDGIWDFSLVDFSAAPSSHYCFRLVYSDGSALETYSTVPEVVTSNSNVAPVAPVNLTQTKTDTTPIPGTNRYNFDGGLQSWTGDTSSGTTYVADASTKRTGTGSLRVNVAGGDTNLYATGPATAPTDISANGAVFSAWVYVPAGTSGAPGADLLVDSSNGITTGGYTLLAIGSWTRLTVTVPPDRLSKVTQFDVFADGFVSAGVKQFYIDDVQQGADIWTNETSVRFVGSVADSNGSDTDSLCIEAQPVGVAFTNTEQSCGTGVAYSGSAVTATDTLGSLTDGTQYHWQARTRDAAGAYSSWVQYGGNVDTVTASADFGIDTSTPTPGVVRDGATAGVDVAYNSGALDSLAANWSGFGDASSGIIRYEYSISTLPNSGTFMTGWIPVSASTTSASVSSLNLHTGQSYYFNVLAVDALGAVKVISSDGQGVAPTMTFVVSTTTLDLGHLTVGNGFTATGSVNVSVATNGYNGYTVRQQATGALASGSNTVPAFGASWTTPLPWSGYGFGYTTSDTDLQGSGDRFAGQTKYAGVNGSLPGDIIADYTNAVSGSPVNATTTIGYKVAVSPTQAAGTYTTGLKLFATVSY